MFFLLVSQFSVLSGRHILENYICDGTGNTQFIHTRIHFIGTRKNLLKRKVIHYLIMHFEKM